MADQVFAEMGSNPLLEIALEDEYVVSRKLYPNVDFYSGLIYQSMGFPMDPENMTNGMLFPPDPSGGL